MPTLRYALRVRLRLFRSGPGPLRGECAVELEEQGPGLGVAAGGAAYPGEGGGLPEGEDAREGLQLEEPGHFEVSGGGEVGGEEGGAAVVVVVREEERLRETRGAAGAKEDVVEVRGVGGVIRRGGKCRGRG